MFSDMRLKDFYLVDGKGRDDVRFLVDDACLSSRGAQIRFSLHRGRTTNTSIIIVKNMLGKQIALTSDAVHFPSCYRTSDMTRSIRELDERGSKYLL